ncbi:MAG: 5'/3'-nucleotidase SurE [Planctomycetota bacterium]
MKVLLTNDDGVEAPGLEALYETVRHALGSQTQITVVAPHQCRSECGHSVTTGRRLNLSQTSRGWYAVDGTPVDCVRVGLGSLVTDAEIVFSGVNAGANLGVDLMVSGTFAAAREASLHGVAAMAISHYRRPEVPKTWSHVARWTASTIDDFINSLNGTVEENHGKLWNVNLPAIDPETPQPPIIRCPVDRLPIARTVHAIGKELEMRADFHSRPHDLGTDVEKCFGGHVTISELAPHI